MHHMPPGCGCGSNQGSNDMLMMFFLLMIMCPGMFGSGDNSMLMILMFMMFSGGKM